MKTTLRITTVLITVFAALFFVGWRDKKVETFHSYQEIQEFQMMQEILPDWENELFAGSGKCNGCHGHDVQGIGSITESGWDVNVVDHWRSTLMANSAKDPFWRAKVTHEVAVNPSHQLELEDKCTSCHAPFGHFNAKLLGAEHYSFAEMLEDPLAMDGVSCGSCHQQDPDSAGQFFSGNLHFVMDTIFGPYGGGKDEPVIVGQPMTSFVGFEPVYGEHITKSETCAGCHTLITNTADLDGNATGDTFVEQATYHEWLNSVYAIEGGNEAQECQGCHFPRINDPVIISANYSWLEPRTPFGLHYMVGGNTFMLQMFKENIDLLGLSATEAQFDTTIAHTMQILQHQTAELTVVNEGQQGDLMPFKVHILNKAGHKFPSGYPARRAFVEFIATDASGNELFRSGELQSDYEVNGHDATYEPHYDIITSEDQVQIYEQVLGDVNGNVTTVLERAHHHLKDNRLVPKGFTSTHFTYDTTEVAGLALGDLNFNIEEGEEGSGTDDIKYMVPLNGYEGEVNVVVKLWYQSSPPKWNEEMFSYSTPQIDLFKELYLAQGAAPVLIKEASATATAVGVEENLATKWDVYPNPLIGNTLWLSRDNTKGVASVMLYDMNGRLVSEQFMRGERGKVLVMGVGAYVLVVKEGGDTQIFKVLRIE